MHRRFFPILLACAAFAPSLLEAQSPTRYFPARGQWQKKDPAALGLDPDKLKEAVEYAQAHGSTGTSTATRSAHSARLRSAAQAARGDQRHHPRHGYIVAEFGDTQRERSRVQRREELSFHGLRRRRGRGLIKNVNDPVAKYIHDGGYDSPHNAKITWKNHLQQESEWEGTMWGKNADFVGVEQFGNGERKPRAIHEPGTYLRVQRRPHQPVLALAAAPVRQRRCPTC